MKRFLAILLIVPMAPPVSAPAQSRDKTTVPECVAMLAARRPPPISYVDVEKVKSIANAVGAAAEGKYVMFAVSKDAAGVTRADVRSTSMSPGQAARIAKSIVSAIAPKRDTASVRFFLLVKPGSPKQSVLAAHGFTCAPTLTNRAEVDRAGGVLLRQFPGIARAELKIWVKIDKDGMVTESRIERSSGNAGLDAAAAKMLERIGRFEDEMTTVRRSSWSFTVPLTLIRRR